MNITELARPEIRNLTPYSAARYAEGLVRLNANETPWPAPGSGADSTLNRYPPERPTELTAELAEYYGVAADEVLVTRGSSEAIDLLIRCFCHPGRDAIVITPPTFGMYRVYADVQGARVHEVPLLKEQGWALNADEIVRHWPADGKVLFICSPNNPTGTPVATDEIALIARLLSGRALVVVDGAYTEFGVEDPTGTLLNSADFNNVAVLRTLSKAFGLAGARCGALLGPPELVRMVGCVLPPYSFAQPCIDAVRRCLRPDARRQVAERVATLTAERDRLAQALADLPGVAEVYPSAANFLLVAVDDAERFEQRARAGGVLVRNFGAQLPGCVRITVGTPAQNKQLLRSLGKL
jgi:histidinol-phosphate aminotransferase